MLHIEPEGCRAVVAAQIALPSYPERSAARQGTSLYRTRCFPYGNLVQVLDYTAINLIVPYPSDVSTNYTALTLLSCENQPTRLSSRNIRKVMYPVAA